jgi:hypothetical protein
VKPTAFVVWDLNGVLGVFEIKADAQEALNNYLIETGYHLEHWEELNNNTKHFCREENTGHEIQVTIEEFQVNDPF